MKTEFTIKGELKHIITTNDVGDIVYACNQAVRITEDKVAKNPDEATCKNCIRINNKLKGDKK